MSLANIPFTELYAESVRLMEHMKNPEVTEHLLAFKQEATELCNVIEEILVGANSNASCAFRRQLTILKNARSVDIKPALHISSCKTNLYSILDEMRTRVCIVDADTSSKIGKLTLADSLIKKTIRMFFDGAFSYLYDAVPSVPDELWPETPVVKSEMKFIMYADKDGVNKILISDALIKSAGLISVPYAIDIDSNGKLVIQDVYIQEHLW